MGSLLDTAKCWYGTYRMHQKSIRRQRKVHLFNMVSVLLPNDQIAALMRGRLLHRLGADIESNVLVRFGVTLRTDIRLHLGEGASIGVQSLLLCDDHIWIGRRVTLGPRVQVMTSTHAIGPSSARMGKVIYQPVRIEDGAWVAAGALLLPGVTVGRGSVVGAGAVVTRSVPENTLVAGVPARVIRELPENTGSPPETEHARLSTAPAAGGRAEPR